MSGGGRTTDVASVTGADRRRVNLLLGGGLAAAVAAIVALGAVGSSPSAQEATTSTAGVAQAALSSCPTASAAAPSAELPDEPFPCINGGEVSLAALTGTPLVINVWGSWCPPCREELPWFASLHEAAGDRLRIVGVDVVDTDDAALSTLIDAGVHYPVVVDPTGRTRGSLGWTTGTPITLLIDAEGRIVHRIVGRVADEATLHALVADRLGVDVG